MVMKRINAFILTFVLFFAFSFNAITAKRHEDYRIIKKAVKKNSHPRQPYEVRWFKLLVTDLWDEEDKIRVSLPLSFIEGILYCSDAEDLHIDCEGYDFNIKDWFDDLKKAGPMSLIEIRGDDVLIKIWLE